MGNKQEYDTETRNQHTMRWLDVESNKELIQSNRSKGLKKLREFHNLQPGDFTDIYAIPENEILAIESGNWSKVLVRNLNYYLDELCLELIMQASKTEGT